MEDTKEKILRTALHLFASNGYEAVSVSDIAGKLGLTKGALYKHYKNKRDIFDSILKRMEQQDAEQAEEHSLPDAALEQTSSAEVQEAYGTASLDDIVLFSKSMFRYWTEDAFASCFRKMLTLEQYRNEEMGRLYQQYLASGPVGYVADLFACIGIQDPRRKAAEFYAPMFLLYTVYDGAEDKEAVTSMLNELLDDARERLDQGEK